MIAPINVQNKGMNLCLIDDDEIQHFYCQKSLQIQGLSPRFLSFYNVEEAISFLNQHQDDVFLLPDIIFLDLQLRRLTGWQFLQQYTSIKHKLKKEIRIYILSSSINPEEIRKAASIPEVAGFFSKPIKPEDLTRVCTLT